MIKLNRKNVIYIILYNIKVCLIKINKYDDINFLINVIYLFELNIVFIKISINFT